MRTVRHACILFTMTLAAGAANAEQTVYFGLTRLDPVSQRATPNAYLVVDDTTIVSIGEREPPATIPRERHAAAVAATLSIDRRRPLREIPADDIRSVLRANGSAL